MPAPRMKGQPVCLARLNSIELFRLLIVAVGIHPIVQAVQSSNYLGASRGVLLAAAAGVSRVVDRGYGGKCPACGCA